METGLPCLVTNLHRHLIKASVDRSGVSSRCNALEVAQVNRQMYAFIMRIDAFHVHKAGEIHSHMIEHRAS